MGKKGEKTKKESEELPTSTIAAGVEAVRTGIDLGLDAYDTGSQFVQTIRLLQDIQNQSTVRGVIDGMNNFYRTTSGVIESGQSMLNNVLKMRDHLKNLSNVLIGHQVIPGWATLFVDSVEFAKASWEQNKDLWAARGLLDGLKGSGAVLKNVFDRVDRNANHFGLTIIDGITLKASKYKRKGHWFISQMGDIIYKRGSTMSKVYGRYLFDYTPKNMERFLKIESLAIGRNRLARRQHKKIIQYKDGEGNYYRLSTDGLIYKIFDAKSGKKVNERPQGVVPQLYSLTQNIDSYTRYYFQLQDLFVAISESLSPGSGLTTVRAAQLEQDYHDVISKIFTKDGKLSLGSFTKAFDEVLALGLDPDELMKLLLKDPKDIELTVEEQKIYNLLENLRNFEAGKPIKGSIDELDEAVMKLHNDNVPIVSHGYFSSMQAIPMLGDTYMNSLTTFRPSLVQDIGYQSLIDSLLLGGTVINTLFGRGLLGNAVGYLTCKAIKLAAKVPFKIVKGSFKLAGFTAVKAYQGLSGIIRWYQERRELEEMSRQLDELLRESEDTIREAENVLASDQQIENSVSTSEETASDAEFFSADEYEPEPKKIKMEDGAEFGEPFSDGFEHFENDPQKIAGLFDSGVGGEIIVEDSDEEQQIIEPLPQRTLFTRDSDRIEKPLIIPAEYDKYDWRWFKNKSTKWIRSQLRKIKDPYRREIYQNELDRRMVIREMPEPTVPLTHNQGHNPILNLLPRRHEQASKTTKSTNVSFKEWRPRTPTDYYKAARNLDNPDKQLGTLMNNFPQSRRNDIFNEIVYGGAKDPQEDYYEKTPFPFETPKETPKDIPDSPNAFERGDIDDDPALNDNFVEEGETYDDYKNRIEQEPEQPIMDPRNEPINEDPAISNTNTTNAVNDYDSDRDDYYLNKWGVDDDVLKADKENERERLANSFQATHQVQMPIVGGNIGGNPDPNGSDSSDSDNDSDNDDNDDLFTIGSASDNDDLNINDNNDNDNDNEENLDWNRVQEAEINDFEVVNNVDPPGFGDQQEELFNEYVEQVRRQVGLPQWSDGILRRILPRAGLPTIQQIRTFINGAKLAKDVVSGALAVVDIYKAVKRIANRRKFKKLVKDIEEEVKNTQPTVFSDPTKGGKRKIREKTPVELVTEMSQEMQNWINSLPDKQRNEMYDAILGNKDNYKIVENIYHQTKGYNPVNKTILKTELDTSFQGGRSLGYVPQKYFDSYLERVFKAKMENTLPVDQTEQSSVLIKEDPIQEKLDTTILDVPEDTPGHFEVTRVDDQAIYVKPIIEANPLSEKILDEDNVSDKVLEKTQEDDFELPEAAPSNQETNIMPPPKTESPVNTSNLIQNDSFDMTLLKVKGNPKVRRCSKCNTFVSLDKTHSARECADRLAKFKASRGKKRTHRRKGKKGDVVLTKAQAKKLLKAKKKIPSALKKILQKSLK